MGIKRVLLGDMGGTSFDTGIIVDNEIHIEKNLAARPVPDRRQHRRRRLGRRRRRLDRLGLRARRAAGRPAERRLDARARRRWTAAATEPTVTDAMVTMGFIDPDNYLGGRVQLKPELSREALDRTFGERFGWSTEEAAAAVHDLVVVNMANAVREVSVGKGHDPREFLFLAYGGTLPLFASQIAERLGITTIVIPQQQLGLLRARAAVLGLRHAHRPGRRLGPQQARGRRPRQRDRRADGRGGDAPRCSREGFTEDQIEIQRSADFRFHGQAYELTLPMPARDAHRGRRAELVRRVPRALRAHLRRGHRVEGRAGLADQLQRHRHRAPAGAARARHDGDRQRPARPSRVRETRATCSCPPSASHERGPDLRRRRLHAPAQASRARRSSTRSTRRSTCRRGPRPSATQYMNYVLTR